MHVLEVGRWQAGGPMSGRFSVGSSEPAMNNGLIRTLSYFTSFMLPSIHPALPPLSWSEHLILFLSLPLLNLRKGCKQLRC